MMRILICSTASICAILTSLPQFDHVKTQRLAMTRVEEQRLQRDCEAMNAEGKIRDLMTELSRSALELEELNLENVEDRDFYRISELRNDIHRIVESAENILRPEWTQNKWPYKATWNIRFADVLEIDPRVIDSNFLFMNFELENLSLGGIEREDLYPFVTVTPSSKSIRVEIEKQASSLELCQLQSTWMLGGTVKYKFLSKSYEERAELTLRPGVVRPPESPAVPKPRWPFEDHRQPDLECLLSPKCLKEHSPFPMPRPWPFPGPDPMPPLNETMKGTMK